MYYNDNRTFETIISFFSKLEYLLFFKIVMWMISLIRHFFPISEIIFQHSEIDLNKAAISC